MRKIHYQLCVLRILQLVCFGLGTSSALFLFGTAGSSELGLISFPQILVRVIVGAVSLFICVFGYRFLAKWQRHIKKRRRTLGQANSIRPAA